MAIDATPPGAITSAPSSAPSSGSSSSSGSGSGTSTPGLADNFQTFLTLLTTQLKNQNPLDPLDTNQFTQQLVQFAQVEQQLKANTQLTTLVNIEKTAQSTQALAFVGATVVVDGSTTSLAKNASTGKSTATWTFNSPKSASAVMTITNSAGQTVYSGNFSLNSGNANFVWDGKGTDGTQWPDGSYKMSVTAKDANGQAVAVSTQIRGVVDSVDLTANPALLSIGGQSYTTDKIKSVVRPTSS
ncbi:flagellar biosynthesis protein FlgD [Bradyrhizobium sp. U87765 SZCCT0131]|uniref:flagellar hook assembly protein FlgD n=1 Tax=unclassified Bradyrhizobium TaxID=2631580 RepID=UPI001BACF3DD|nr:MULTISPECIES: flagellar hook capping FlgD N-terminal domain-containing protein [unclassified Bradyrhizobium]MBR1218583.1 flagellar biosynthesis protein FlgD [Bradyrhizobium sp. U87765 SZCCT0131]MBR1265658.1 flagellar biosynthesis protein FlgD [Bradyrhizobium sp. U87765 SZCCT0134]MBR1304081.1 flagellar biosynthesis protein FlgD [Bradyrhizobium sp. U87765 SZCCT0110]MBR1319687.1 flagellar biosynthesis protein FlgD [Bradyrhizobium sp. U87765 SZCCT0109]MBR1348012.1 flagellar biosynthesis protein